ncbi:carbohydrate ABC transporter permease [Microbacterium stercoris]|uniref:Carbohydrate ABC transporter permease n=1 Tax=Microbacterium stercoris TaxID=2820289 RepID=A0A939QGB8_9MICO|nr:carbohydrate ABC transporter permease [Microbacterium stercoris]MBO3662238.1 carbohydrate ABC transporter permease [Microbacterium stercoris]
MHTRYRGSHLVREVVLIAVAALWFIPILALVNVSLKPINSQTNALTFAWPPTFDNYIAAWQQASLGAALANSAIVAVISVAGIVAVSALASYPLARVTRRWSRWTFYAVLCGLLIPAQLALLPLYVTMRDLGLLGSLWAVILINIGTAMPFSIFLYTTFLRDLPTEYEEAAVLDGCGPVRSFLQVVFPLVRPATGTVVILNLVGIWNEFFVPLLYLSGSGNTTAPVAIYSFVSQYVTVWPLVFAGLVITVIPILIVYFSLQKYVIKGFASGLKG